MYIHDRPSALPARLCLWAETDQGRKPHASITIFRDLREGGTGSLCSHEGEEACIICTYPVSVSPERQVSDRVSYTGKD